MKRFNDGIIKTSSNPLMIRDILWNIFSSPLISVGDVLSFKLVCKLWKIVMEQSFDHSYQKNLPLCFNCENGNYKEVKRLLETLPTKSGYLDFEWGSPFFTKNLEIVKLLVSHPKIRR